MKMLHFQIDPHSGLPVYRQLMDQTKYYIASGVLKAGDLLPSIRELSAALAVNPTTVVKAYGELEHESVIQMRHGKGAFVAEGSKGASSAEARRALQRLARQLAVEAAQMGASREDVQKLVAEEIEQIKGKNL